MRCCIYKRKYTSNVLTSNKNVYLEDADAQYRLHQLASWTSDLRCKRLGFYFGGRRHNIYIQMLTTVMWVHFYKNLKTKINRKVISFFVIKTFNLLALYSNRWNSYAQVVFCTWTMFFTGINILQENVHWRHFHQKYVMYKTATESDDYGKQSQMHWT